MNVVPTNRSVIWLAAALLGAWSAAASAQVPQDSTFTGRLVDGLGDPLTGPVDLELRIFDTDIGGAALYAEQHLGVALDATGGFAVQLGLGTSPSGSFDASLFAGVDRWLEVVVGSEVLAPRRVVGSVPWSLVAQQANTIVPDPGAPRFEDCGNGTVVDHKTGLAWEKKTGTLGTPVDCSTSVCSDPHDVNNRYIWSVGGADPDGDVFTDFLPRLNGELSPFAPAGCLADHCDWRLPTISELQQIMVGLFVDPAQSATCSVAPCLDPDLVAVDGPSASARYWSSTVSLVSSGFVFLGDLTNGGVAPLLKNDGDYPVRAVRVGACY